MPIKGIIEKLVAFGLAPAEARVYVALLRRPAAPPADLAQAAAVPQPKVYGVLRRLLEAGLARRLSGRPVIYRPVPPKEVLVKLRARERERRLSRDRFLASLADDLGGIYAGADDDGGPSEYIEIVKEPGRIVSRWAKLAGQARRSIVAFNKGPYALPLPAKRRRARSFAPVIAALERGVDVRAVYELDGDESPARREAIAYLAARGEQARVAPAVPVKMSVYDGRDIFVALEDPATAAPTLTCLVVRHRALATALEMLFEKVWEEATPVEDVFGKAGRRRGGRRRKKVK